MPADDSLLAQGTVDFRNEERRARFHGECMDCGLDDYNCQCYDDPDDDWDCTHCCGEGTCDANANPLWDCDDQPHNCHACGGTGKRRDQTIF